MARFLVAKQLGSMRPVDEVGEEWRPCVGFFGYEVSNFGRVRRVIGGPGTWAGRILKLQHDTRRCVAKAGRGSND